VRKLRGIAEGQVAQGAEGPRRSRRAVLMLSLAIFCGICLVGWFLHIIRGDKE
jgi:hypothetical protein